MALYYSMNFLKKSKLLAIILCFTICAIGFMPYGIAQESPVKPAPATKIQIRNIEDYNKLVIYYRFYKPDSAIYLANIALKICIKKNDYKGIGIMLNHLGIINENQGNLLLAEKRYLAAITQFRRIDFKYGIADEYNRLGVLKLRKADYPEATQYFVTALKIYEKIKSKHGIVECYLKLGTIQQRQNNNEAAHTYYKKAEQLNAKLSFSSLTLYIYNSIGWLYLKNNEYNKALPYFETGYRLSNHPQYQSLHLTFSASLGSCYAKLGRSIEARKILDENLPIAVRNKFYDREMQILSALSDAWAVEDFSKAKAYLDTCVTKSKLHGDTERYIRALKSLSNLYALKGDYKSALGIEKTERSSSDSLFNLKRALEIGNLNANYQLQKSNADNSQLKLLNRKNQIIRRGMLIVSCIIFIILVITLYFYLRSKKLNKQMDQANKSLTALNAELQAHHTVKDKMFSIIGHDLRSPLANVIGVLELLNDDDLNQAERKEIIEKLSVHSKTSMEMLDNLLTWGQAQVKGIYLSQQFVDIKGIIANNITLLRISSEEKKIIIQDLIASNTMIWADPTHVDFVIRNLIANSIKYCPPQGSIIISSAAGNKPGFTDFFINDNGRGIKADRLQKIFNIQSESTTGTAGEKGTGLGLIMCKGFITANGGEMTVESVEGEGSTFRFSLQNHQPDLAQ